MTLYMAGVGQDILVYSLVCINDMSRGGLRKYNCFLCSNRWTFIWFNFADTLNIGFHLLLYNCFMWGKNI